MANRNPISAFERAMFARAHEGSREMAAGRWLPVNHGRERIGAVARTITELGLLPQRATGLPEVLRLADAMIHALNSRGYDVVATDDAE